MKYKVDFKKLVWGDYHCGPVSFAIELEIINWLFKTGLENDNYQECHGWYRSGINQLLYGYSANNEPNRSEPFPIHDGNYLCCFMQSIFVRAFLAPYSHDGFPKKISQWREKNRINIEKYRFFNMPDPSDTDVWLLLYRISTYKGKELKRHLFHPEFTGRSHPGIIEIKFSTFGKGYFVSLEFSFWEFNYEPGWTHLVAEQNEGEYIGDFLKRAEKELERITINTDICKRLQFEAENHFMNFVEKNCGNCTWLKDRDCKNCNHERDDRCDCFWFNEGNADKVICGLMDLRGIKKFVIEDKYGHVCDEWRVKNYSHYKEEPAGD